MSCDRCKANKTNSRARCKNHTCARKDYCSPHLEREEHLAIRKSTIPNAGLGLFTTVDRKKGELIDFYTGQYLTLAELEERYPNDDSKYVLGLNKNLFVDAVDPYSCWARYANAPQTGRGNCRFVVDNRNKRASIKTTKKVSKGSELLVPYGRSYWL